MSTYTARKKEALRRGISNIKLLSTSALVAAGTLALGTGMAHADNWVDLTTTSGSTTTDLSQENTTNIGINSGRAIVEGDLDINAGWTVNVGTGDLVAIDRENDATFIYGRLNCAGSCHVLDGDGIIVGDTGVVDSRSVTFGTGELLNPQGFMDSGKLELGNFGAGGIEVNGVVNVAEAGLAAFVSPTVTNNGVINAKMGTVAFAAGETVTLDLYGDGLVEIVVDGELADALLENKGAIAAEGGTVQMTALAAKSAVDNIINVEGVVTVASATQQGGKIVLSGGSKGTVSVSGNLDAAGTDGGDVSITGENVHVTDSAYINVDGGRGSDGQGDGGTVNIFGDKYAVLEGKLFGRGGENGGNGGNAELSAGDSVGFNGIVDLGATNGEVGTFVIDPAHLYINNTYSFFGFGFGPIDTLTVYDQAIANALANNDVKLWATETLSTGSDIDVSQYSYDVLVTPGYLDTSGPIWTWNWVPAVYDTVTELTTHDLQLAAPQVNLVHDITLGQGSLNVADILDGDSVLGFGLITPWTDIIVDELNLDGKIYTRTAPLGSTVLASDAQINTTADTINVLSNDALIQQAVHFADAADADAETINVAAGTYNENVVIDRALNLDGVSSDATAVVVKGTGTGNGITLASDDISIRYLTVDGFANGIYTDSAINNIFMRNVNSRNNTNYGFEIHNNAVVDGLDLRNMRITGNGGYGLRVRGSVNNLDMHGGLISGNKIGLGSVKGNGDGTYLTDVSIRNVTFTNNAEKAVYMEKLSDAELKELDIRTSGTSGPYPAGIDINLKYGDYQNITLDGTKVRTSATGAGGNAITVKARDDNSYAGSPATLTNLNIINSDIETTGGYGIAVGNAITGALLEDNTVKGATGAGIIVYGGGTDINLTNNQIHNSAAGIAIFDIDGTDAAHPGIQLISNDIFGGGTAIYVENSDFAKLWHNNVQGQSGDGIVVSGGTDANLRFNWARFLDGNGISVSNNANALIDSSNVKDVGKTGIYAFNLINGTISANKVNGTTNGNGIMIKNGDVVSVTGNTVSNISRKGIYADSVKNATIEGNFVDTTTEEGIYAKNLKGTTKLIKENTVDNTGRDGIAVIDSASTTVLWNKVGTTGGTNNIKGDGVFAQNSDGVLISGNTISETHSTSNAKGSGVQVISSDNARIDQNIITNAGWDGIRVIGGDLVVLDENKMTDSQRAGIYAEDLTNGTIGENTVNGTNQFRGISVKGGDSNEVVYNYVDNTNLDGIIANGVSNLTVEGNQIGKNGGNIGGDGIEVIASHGAAITGNQINDTDANGIYNSGSNNTTISGNTITNTGLNGILVNPSTGVTVSGNTIDFTGDDGVEILLSNGATVSGNFIGTNGGNIGDNGIEVETSHDVVITDNEINDTDANGIFVNLSDRVEIGGAAAGLGNTITRAGAHGILVTGGEDALIQYNTVKGTNARSTGFLSFAAGDDGAQLDGIHVENNDGVDILDNTITAGQGLEVKVFGVTLGASGGNGANGHGIFVSGSDSAVIDQNTVSGDLLGNGVGAGENGIHVEGSNLLTVGGLLPLANGNKIFSTGNDGIHIDGSFGALVLNNIIGGVPLMDVADDGIDLNNTIGSLVAGNIITGTGDDGIEITNSALSAIALNAINGVGDDGIDINNAALLLVALNQIGDAAENGIQANNTLGLALAGNIITDAGEDGIHADNGILSIISGNEISGSDDDGIDVSNQILTSINGNTVDESGDNGIQADNLLFASIADNVVTDSDQDGITVGNSALVTIADNVVAFSGDDGIDVDDSAAVSVLNNLVVFSGDDGIEFDSSIFGTIDGNATLFSADNGIEIEDSAFVDVTDNFTAFSGNAGIYVDPSFFVNVSGNTAMFNTVGIEFDEAYFSTINNNNVAFNLVGISVEDSAFIDVSNNNVAFNLLGVHVGDTAFATVNNNNIFFNLLGVNVQDSAFIDISENTIAGNLIGVRLDDVALVNVEGNDIYNNLFMGLWADGANNGYIRLAGNTFTDNMIGARFESGAIDLSDTLNPNSFIFTPGYTAPLGAPVVGMQFDSADPKDPNALTIVGNTLGTTQFQGFISRPVGDAYYVRIEDDTLLDAGGAPVVIDGTFASWDGLVPDTFGNVLPSNVLQALEDRLFDADDAPVDGRGQIFVGDALQTLENIEDFFNQFAPFDGGATGLNVTLLGMPYTGIGAFNLANIAPAAGGDDQSPESLADIEPAAGGEDAACWGDALNAAAGGKAANFSFGGSFEESLADASSCGS